MSFRIGSAVLLVLVMLGGGFVAGAQVSHGSLGPAEGWELLLRDAQSYAQEYEVELAEAVRRLVIQGLAGDLDAKLAHQERETFAGLWIEHEPEFRIVVQFTDGDGADRLARFTRGGALADLTRARRADVPLVQLLRDQRSAMEVATEIGQRVDAGIDVKANRVALYVMDAIALDAGLAGFGLTLPSTVAVVPTPRLAAPAAVLYAGLDLTTCTSGFAVKNGSGTRGILTAGHCPNSQSFQGSALTFQSEACGNGKDVQWHTTSQTIKGWINVHHNNDPALSVNGFKPGAQQAIGEYVCKVGLTTGYTCGTISDKYFQPIYAVCSPHTATYLRLTAGGANLVDGGDSGGPVFVGGTAYGLVVCEVFENDLCYMPIDFISAIGVSLVTTDPFPSSAFCQNQCDSQYATCSDGCLPGPGHTQCVNQCENQRDQCLINC